MKGVGALLQQSNAALAVYSTQPHRVCDGCDFTVAAWVTQKGVAHLITRAQLLH